MHIYEIRINLHELIYINKKLHRVNDVDEAIMKGYFPAMVLIVEAHTAYCNVAIEWKYPSASL